MFLLQQMEKDTEIKKTSKISIQKRLEEQNEVLYKIIQKFRKKNDDNDESHLENKNKKKNKIINNN